jgi:hypothetical protein
MKGQVFGLVVRSRGFAGNLSAGLRSLIGGEISEYTELLEDTRRQALDRMVQNEDITARFMKLRRLTPSSNRTLIDVLLLIDVGYEYSSYFSRADSDEPDRTRLFIDSRIGFNQILRHRPLGSFRGLDGIVSFPPERVALRTLAGCLADIAFKTRAVVVPESGAV